MFDMMPEIDEELTAALAEEIERAFHEIDAAHAGENFYIACVVFNEQMMARFEAFSEEGLVRACREQEITDEKELNWYKFSGYDVLCEAYDYVVPLTECNKLLTERSLALPDASAMDEERTLRISSASAALQRVNHLFGKNCICMAKIAPNRSNPLPPGSI